MSAETRATVDAAYSALCERFVTFRMESAAWRELFRDVEVAIRRDEREPLVGLLETAAQWLDSEAAKQELAAGTALNHARFGLRAGADALRSATTRDQVPA